MTTAMSEHDFSSLSYEIMGIIGKGGTSTVYKIRSYNDDAVFAMKEIEVDQLSSSQVSAIQAEIRTLENLSHPNIVSFYGMKTDMSKFYLFMEYADYGSLRIFYKNYGFLTTSEAQYCVRQLVDGLEYLHQKGVAHRDIKCANSLIFHKDYRLKLADFGASKRIEHESIISGLKGTPQWMAPEVIKGTQKTDGWIKADIWSLGCTIVEMVTAKLPYAQYNNPMTAMYRIASGEIPQIDNERLALMTLPSSSNSSSPRVQWRAEDQLMMDFIHQCCTVDPLSRPSVDQLKSLPWLKFSINEVPMRLFSHPAPVASIAAQSTNAASFLSLPQTSDKSKKKKSVSSDVYHDDNVDLGIEVDEEIEDDDDALAHSYRSPTKKNTSSSSASASSLPTANRTYRYQKAPEQPSQKGKVDWEQAFDCDESVASEASERTIERHKKSVAKAHAAKHAHPAHLLSPSEEEYVMNEEVVDDDNADDDYDEQFYHDDFEGDEQHQHIDPSRHHQYHHQHQHHHQHMDEDGDNENNISQLTGFGEDDPEDFEVIYRQQQQQQQQDAVVGAPSRPVPRVDQSISNMSAVSAPAAIVYHSNHTHTSPRYQQQEQQPLPVASNRSKLAAKMDSLEVGALYSDPAFATVKLDPQQLADLQKQQVASSVAPPPSSSNITPTTQVRKVQKAVQHLGTVGTRRAPSTAEGIPASQKVSQPVSHPHQQSSKSQSKLISAKAVGVSQSSQAQGLKPGAARMMQRQGHPDSLPNEHVHVGGAHAVVVRKVHPQGHVGSRAVGGTKAVGNGVSSQHHHHHPHSSGSNNNHQSHATSKLRSRSAGVYLSPPAVQKQGGGVVLSGGSGGTRSSPSQDARRMEVLPEGNERSVRTAPAVPGAMGGLSVVTEGKVVSGHGAGALGSLSANAKKLQGAAGGVMKKQRLSMGPTQK